MDIGIILLAAGSSSRMGQSKQLLKIKDVPLLLHAATVAIQTGMRPVVIVLGANEIEHQKIIKHLEVEIVSNQHWRSGMGSSLKAGLTYLLQHYPRTEAAIVMVCDQPLLTSDHLKKITEGYEKSLKKIVASNYFGAAGAPALFHKTLFSEILEIPDDQGAKKIIQQHRSDTAMVDFPEGSIDLDTPDDYEKFII